MQYMEYIMNIWAIFCLFCTLCIYCFCDGLQSPRSPGEQFRMTDPPKVRLIARLATAICSHWMVANGQAPRGNPKWHGGIFCGQNGQMPLGNRLNRCTSLYFRISIVMLQLHCKVFTSLLANSPFGDAWCPTPLVDICPRSRVAGFWMDWYSKRLCHESQNLLPIFDPYPNG